MMLIANLHILNTSSFVRVSLFYENMLIAEPLVSLEIKIAGYL